MFRRDTISIILVLVVRSMILDYSNYIERNAHRGVVNYSIVDSNSNLFQDVSTCPFCNQIVTKRVYSKSKYDCPAWLRGSFDQFEDVVQCPICGWWEYKYMNSSDAIDDGIRASDLTIVTALLRQYGESDKEIPIATLRKYIEKNPEKIYGIHTSKMEELVKAVFSDFYPHCEVSLVGKSHDGGKDIVIIENDGGCFFVQVKRRTKKEATEGVSFVRELLGASIIEDNVKGCIFVSTADHYSKPSEEYAKKAVEKRLVESFELIDCSRFLTLMDLTKNVAPDIWKKFLTL